MIDPNDSCTNGLNHAHGLENVASPDGSGQAVGRIVGNLERVFFVVEGNDSGNRAKDFFAGDTGGIRHVVEDGGLDVVALGHLLGAAAAGSELGFLLANFDVGIDAVVLLLADQRSHLGVAFEWRPDLDCFRFLGHGLDEFFVDGFLDQNAAARGTDFTLIDEYAKERAINGVFEVGVGEEYVGRLATEFESDALHGVSGLLDDDLADGGAAGKGNLVDVGMLDERSAAGLAKAGDDVDDPRRQAAVGEVFGEFKRGERSLLGGLQDAGAACGDGGRELPRSHHQGKIPRDDLSGDADRLFERKGHRVVGDGVHVADNLGGEAAIVFEAGGGIGDVALGFDNGLTAVAALEFGERGEIGADLFGETEKNSASLLRGGARPRAVFKCGFGRGNRAVHVVGAGIGDLSDHFFGRGIVDRESFG